MRSLWSATARLYLKDRWTRLAIIFAVIAGATEVFLIMKFLPSADNIILHYNVYFGIDLLGSWRQLLLLPLAATLLAAINIAVGIFIWRRDRVITYVLHIGTILFLLFGVIAAILLVYINR